jgi:AcrR family transcriptional regulator
MERRGTMSGSGHLRATVRNRRVDRTYRELLAAFRDLMFECGYSRLTVRAIIDRANVGRSTFYEHFRNKEDVLRESIAPILTPLADIVSADHSDEQVRAVVEHVWAVRERTATAMLGPTRTLIVRILADLLEDRLAPLAAPGGAAVSVPVRLIAAAIADAQIGLLATWIRHEAPAPADAVAHALVTVSRGAAEGCVRAATAETASRVRDRTRR